MSKTFYLTTPLYYVNAEPHIGSAYTTIAADAICRFQRLLGNEVCLLTGVDEHGGKIEATALSRGVAPQAHCDEISNSFKVLWERLKINYQKFSRTSGEKHNKVVQAFYERVKANGDIYQAEYKGLYCLACEDFKNERELLEGQLCPIHHTKVQEYTENNYFFALSKYTDKLIEFFKNNPDFIQPRFRQHEVNAWINEGLKDFPISRRSVKWGIPIPRDEEQTIYVWFDALLGYLSPLLDDEVVSSDNFDLAKELSKLAVWPASVHLIGKDILRFHAVYWIAMLMSAGFPLPERLFGHGFLTKDGEKMGKTRGNIIVPNELLDQFGLDAVRFYFLFNIPFGQDGDYTEQSFKETVNAYLANRVGNLFSRVIKLIETNLKITPQPPCKGEQSLSFAIQWDEKITLDINSPIAQAGLKLPELVKASMQNLEPHAALQHIFDYVDKLNLYLTDVKPWNLFKLDDEESKQKATLSLIETLEGLRIVANLLEPFIPQIAERMLSVFGLEKTNNWAEINKWNYLTIGQKLNNPGILFSRIN